MLALQVSQKREPKAATLRQVLSTVRPHRRYSSMLAHRIRIHHPAESSENC